MNFVQQVLKQFDLFKEMFVFYNSCFFVYFVIILWVLDFEIGLFHKPGNLFKLIVSISGVMKHDSVELFDQVRVKISFDGMTDVFDFLELVL